jgi:hypothetical protein
MAGGAVAPFHPLVSCRSVALSVASSDVRVSTSSGGRDMLVEFPVLFEGTALADRRRKRNESRPIREMFRRCGHFLDVCEVDVPEVAASDVLTAATVVERLSGQERIVELKHFEGRFYIKGNGTFAEAANAPYPMEILRRGSSDNPPFRFYRQATFLPRDTWTDGALTAWFRDPQAVVPGFEVFDAAALATAQARAQRYASRLLAIDGDIYCRTDEPTLRLVEGRTGNLSLELTAPKFGSLSSGPGVFLDPLRDAAFRLDDWQSLLDSAGGSLDDAICAISEVDIHLPGVFEFDRGADLLVRSFDRICHAVNRHGGTAFLENGNFQTYKAMRAARAGFEIDGDQEALASAIRDYVHFEDDIEDDKTAALAAWADTRIETFVLLP